MYTMNEFHTYYNMKFIFFVFLVGVIYYGIVIYRAYINPQFPPTKVNILYLSSNMVKS